MSLKEKILIADDSEMNQMLLEEILSDKYEYVMAKDGTEAVDILEKNEDIDLVMLDGFGVLEIMNLRHWISEVSVIIISSESDVDFIRRGYDLGASDYISRPFDLTVVRRRVENTLMLYARQKRLVRLVEEQVYEREKTNNTMINILSHVIEYRNNESGQHILHVRTMTDIPGTGYITRDPSVCKFDHITLPSFEDVRDDKRLYAEATRTEYAEHDPIRGRAMIQPCEGRYLIINPPAMPLDTKELDRVAELPYTREWHPMYEPLGGVPAIEEVRFSVIHNRGCFGGCSFCALAFHQGRMITSRSHASVIREVEAMTHHPLWKGYVSDVGGPSANFRHPSCRQQLERGMCPNRLCLAPTPCPNIDADHSDYLALLRKLRQIPGVKKVFVRSGIRYDYMLCDDNDAFFRELVRYHISGQLKVAPEHCIDSVLDYMGKPHIGTYERFMDEYRQLNHRYDKEQYVVPYLMSSHPGSTLADAVALAEYLNRRGRQPEQVQDFYPTPGTISTCMYHTGIDPRTMQPVYVAKTPHEKDMQRALLQWRRPDKRRLVIQALHEAGREDLIGFGKDCLVRPMTDRRKPARPAEPQPPQRKYGKVYGGGKKPASARAAQSGRAGKSAKSGKPGRSGTSAKPGAPRSGGRGTQPPRGKGGRR